jgi:hypothetical protein
MSEAKSETEDSAAGADPSENNEAEGRRGQPPKSAGAANDPTTTVPRDEPSGTTVPRDDA